MRKSTIKRKIEINKRWEDGYGRVKIIVDKKLAEDTYKKLRSVFRYDYEWFDFFNSVFPNARCDDYAYLEIGKNINLWVNFDFLFDGQTEFSGSHAFGSEEEFERKFQKFLTWWNNEGVSIVYLLHDFDLTKRFVIELEKLKNGIGTDKIEIPDINYNEHLSSSARLVINGKVYSLQLEEEVDETEFIEKQAKIIQERFNSFKKVINKMIADREQRIKTQIDRIISHFENIAVIPDWLTTHDILKYDIHIEKGYKGNPALLLPIKYEPRYIKRSSGYYKIIKPLISKRLYLKVHIIKGTSKLSPPIALYRKNGKRFHHYHSYNSDEKGDCIGTLKFPDLKHDYKSELEILLEWRDQVEQSFQVINYPDTTHDNPNNSELPHVLDFEVEEVELWGEEEDE